MINADMIAGGDPHIHRETHFNARLTNLVFHEALELGYRRYFLERPLPVEDDRIPLQKPGFPLWT